MRRPAARLAREIGRRAGAPGASGTGATRRAETGAKQYIVVAVSERDHEGELVAFALP